MALVDVHKDLDAGDSLQKAGHPTGKGPADGMKGHILNDVPPTNTQDRALQELLQANRGAASDASAMAEKVVDAGSEDQRQPEDSNGDEIVKKRKLSTGDAEPIKASQRPSTPQKTLSKAEQQELKMAKAKQDQEKKRLLGEEKARKAQEKEEKAREREEKAKQKEAEKTAREEAKRLKDEVRAQEKAKKDQAKAEKEEEKAKKERSQMRLNAFFGKKDGQNTSAGPSRQASLEPTSPRQTPTKGQQEGRPRMSDFDKTFPPFFLHPHTTLASSRSSRPTEANVTEAWGQICSDAKAREEQDGLTVLRGTFKKPSTNRPTSRYPYRPTKQLVALSSCTQSGFIDLTSSTPSSALTELRAIPMKYLKYHEDVRPPYIGTFTKQPSVSVAKLCRKPATKGAFSMLNYEYDSEAEWEEPEEGEDLGSEDEDDPEEEDDEEMEDFIDDEGVEKLSPKKQTADDLVPKSTGPNLYYEEDHDTTVIPYGDEYIDMERFRMQILLPGVNFPIDPFSTKYWDAEPEDKGQGTTEGSSTTAAAGSISANAGSLAGTKRKKGFKVPAKPLPAELVQDFKDFVLGKALSKLGMVEVLKDKFPQITKATLEQTLEQVAKREGKKWVAI